MKAGDVVELSPGEAQKLNNEGWHLVWRDKEPHKPHYKGEPSIREYVVLGFHRRGSPNK